MYFDVNGAAVNASARFFQKRYPWKPKKNYTYEEQKLLKKRYNKWATAYTIIAMLLFFILPVVYGYTLYSFYAILLSLIYSTGTFYLVQWLAFAMPGLLIALCTIVFIAEKVMMLLLGSRFDEFIDFYNTKNEYDTRKAGIAMAKVFIVPAIIALLMVSTSRIILHKDSFTIKPFYILFDKTYKYNDVAGINFIKSYYNVKRQRIDTIPAVFVHMNDGYELKSGIFFEDIADAIPFANQLSTKTKLPVDTVDVYTN